MAIAGNVSPQWLEEQYRLWRAEPERLSADWRAFFEGFDLARERPGVDCELALKTSAVDSLIYRYRDLGHLQAWTNPLDDQPPTALPDLALAAFGLEETDLDRTFRPLRYPGPATLREIIATLQATYCGSVGVEFMHSQEPSQRQWLKERMETSRNRAEFTAGEQLAILAKLQEATLFEEFLHRHFLGQKRFSLEGGEGLIPFLDALVNRATASGVTDLVMGMSHRGRLNVLANIFGKPLENIFAEFQDNLELAFVGEGDVKYHQGFSADRQTASGRIHLSLASNPSHLEAVDPVVLGKCRARHVSYGPGGRKRVLPLLIHGDAAFAGQGIVTEVFNLSQLDGYQSGGTVHVVLNNQIGFTTDPVHARSTPYATDVAKMLAVPIFHVNGEDQEALVHVARLALEYRQTFARDVVVELLCYRRHGHNEGDEPAFTQPLMYEKIRRRRPAHELYATKLEHAGMPRSDIEASATRYAGQLEAALTIPADTRQGLGFYAKWEKVQREVTSGQPDTAVPHEHLRESGERLARIPGAFNVHPKVARVLEKRREAIALGAGLDWATGEALAFATLLTGGVPVRLSGQDCRRGTFNQRHAVLIDQKNGHPLVPLAFLAPGQAPVQLCDSMLSEAAVLGFEYGYSLEVPEGLTIWEAQFGDFANGAQVIIDQFIASSEAKWDRSSGLVLMLPHGYEGQGPEHSSARIERYLSLCAENNLQVVFPSTPAQLFHLLRRQVKLPYRRPLIVFTPKSLLRLPACVSSLTEFSGGRFAPLLADPEAPPEVHTLLLCTGKIYYELAERRRLDASSGVTLWRIEQLYPLRLDALREASAAWPQLTRIVWVQEEPENMGAWPFLRPQLASLFGRGIEYVGRPAMATTAVGSHRRHGQEQALIIDTAFGVK
ncbi:MAG: 2-oxoglutarate dehydrogenase E1 component [Desulfuromonas sp.]|nr:2-oxoglutarate dehydrogenase E1 component [Desulfuromonas sp.]